MKINTRSTRRKGVGQQQDGVNTLGNQSTSCEANTLRNAYDTHTPRIERNWRIQIDKYLERIVGYIMCVFLPFCQARERKGATMTLNERVYGVRVAKVKQEIKARISTLKRRRR